MDPFFDPEGQPDPTQPEFWSKNKFNPKKRVRFGRTFAKLYCHWLDFLQITKIYFILSYNTALEMVMDLGGFYVEFTRILDKVLADFTILEHCFLIHVF